METVGNSSYLPFNDEKRCYSPGAEPSNWLWLVVTRLLDSLRTGAAGPISTNTVMKGRWTVPIGDLQYVVP